MAKAHLHETHPEIAKRLKRAEGHLKSVITMLDEGRECLVIAQQLHAVEKAISQAKRTLIQDHIGHCLDDAITTKPTRQGKRLEEFKEITKYL